MGAVAAPLPPGAAVLKGARLRPFNGKDTLEDSLRCVLLVLLNRLMCSTRQCGNRWIRSAFVALCRALQVGQKYGSSSFSSSVNARKQSSSRSIVFLLGQYVFPASHLICRCLLNHYRLPRADPSSSMAHHAWPPGYLAPYFNGARRGTSGQSGADAPHAVAISRYSNRRQRVMKRRAGRASLVAPSLKSDRERSMKGSYV